jgi:hypothetical protein
MSLTKFKRIYVESLDGIQGSTHYQWTNVLPQPVNNATMAEVSLVSIPFLFYSIPAYMQNLFFEYTPAGAPVPGTRTYQCTIPTNVNYSLATFTAALNASLANALVIASTAVPSDVGAVDNLSTKITFALNSPTAANGNKITFTVNPSGDTIRFVPYGFDRSSIYYHNLSFRIGYGLPTDSGVPYSNTAGYVAANGASAWSFPNILRTQFIMVASDFSSGDTFATSQDRYNIIAKVPIPSNTAIGEVVQFQAQLPDPYTIRQLPRSFQSMSFQLIDDEGEVCTDLPRAGSGSVAIQLLFRFDKYPEEAAL